MSDPRALLTEIRDRANAALSAPWYWQPYMNGGQTLASPNPGFHELNVLKTTDDWPPTDQDAEFIAHARQDVPKLLAMLESVLGYCDERMEANPRFPDGRPDGITIGLQMAATDIRRRLENF